MTDSPTPTPTPSPAGKYLDTETWDALKAAGFTEEQLQADQPFGPMIFSYTRAQAIADGVLVDLCQPSTADLIRDAGFRLHVAITATAFSEAVCPIAAKPELPPGQSLRGRLWDVLTVLRYTIRAALKVDEHTDRVHFQVRVNDGPGRPPRSVCLWCQVGPGDEGESVLTIMLEGED
jgi:hypothetical protein